MGRCRWSQQQKSCGKQTNLWISNLQSHENDLVLHAWTASWTGIRPQILLRRQLYYRAK
jgi:hypothetical protein